MRSKIVFQIVLSLLLLNSCDSFLFSQQQGTIHGKVTAQKSGAPLPGANIAIFATDMGAAADSSGYYCINNIPAGNYILEASHIGFEPMRIDNVVLTAGETRNLNFSLKQKVLELSQVNIEAERIWENYIADVSMVGVQRMKSKQIMNIPGAFDDPTRAVQIFSGVAGAGDFNSFLAVRGGSPDQNLIVMDGVVIPNPYRFRLAMGGGLSIFDPHITQDVYLHLGGFSAEFGNKLSSVLEVETKHGNRDRYHLQGSINLTDAAGLIEGPLPGKKGCWILSARRTYFDWIAEQLITTNSVFPYCSDIHGKIFYEINKNNHLSVRLMKNEEGTRLISELADNVNLNEDSQTDLVSLSWWSFFSRQLKLRTILSYYKDSMRYHSFNIDTTRENQDYEKLNDKVSNFALKQNMRYQYNENNWLNAGIYWCHIQSDIGFKSQERNFYYARNEFPAAMDYNNKEHYFAGYVETINKLSPSAQMRLGLRYSYSTLIDNGELSPRFNLWHRYNDRTTIELSWGICYQNPDPLTLFTRDQPVDFSRNRDVIAPEKATHYAIGLRRNLGDHFELKLDLYYRDIDRLILPEDQTTYMPSNSGIGVSKGIEILIEKKATENSKLTGIIAYSYGSSKYRNINSTEWIPFNYNRRHGLTVWGNYKLFKSLDLAVLWRISSGLPYTDVVGTIIRHSDYASFDWDFVRGKRNNNNFAPYQRLDIRFNYRYSFKNRFLITLYLDLINLYNYHNIYNITWEKQEVQEQGKTTKLAKKRTIYMLPFLPSLGISLSL